MTDDTSLTARLRDAVARLAPTQDGDVSPQARDERPITVGREEHTQEPDRDDIDRWVEAYYDSPLIRNPIRNFAADVVEPGYRVQVDAGDQDEPTVPSDYPMAEYRGMALSAALERWLSSAAIVGGRFDRDFSDLLEDVVIDLRGRRGTALIEHAYDDPREREFILGLRAFKAETTTAYTREGKNVDHIKQQIEYILTALPTPLYRVGFAGDINRDVTAVQQDDYREEVARERDRLESAFHDLLHQKAREFLTGSAKGDAELDVDVALRIRPAEAESPLEDEAVDPDEFSSLMQGLKAGAPGGAVEQVVPPHEIRETFLGLSPEPPEAPDANAEALLPRPDETDPDVRATFRDAYLATQYAEGDVVQSPQGLGVVTAVETEPFTGKNDEEIDASESSPTYVVGLKDQRVGVGFYSASELDSAEMPDPGVEDPVGALTEDADAVDPDAAALAETTFGIPESWEESPKPNRLILLDAWSSMGGTFEGARRELGSKRLAASMKDRVLQWEGWREGG